MTTTTTNPPVMSQPPAVAMNNKMSASSSLLKTSLDQGKRIIGTGKNTKSADKGKKHVFISTPGPVTSKSAGPSSNLRNKLRDKAKVTSAMIQELTEELQAIDQEPLNDEQDLEATQESDLEQEDSEDCLTDVEEQ